MKKRGSGKKGFIGLNKDVFVDSFRQDIVFLYVILTDVISYAVLYLLMIFLLPVLVFQKFQVFYATLLQQTAAKAADFPEALSSLNRLGFDFAVSSLVFMLIIMLLISAFKGMIWYLIEKKRFDLNDFLRNFFFRYLMTIILLSVSFVALFYFSFQVFKQDYFIMFFLLVQLPVFFGYYFISGAVLMKERSFPSIRKTLSVMFNIKHMAIPIIISLLMFAIIFAVLVGLSIPLSYIGLPGRYFTVLSIFVYIIFFNWAKYYFRNIIRLRG